jgi:hypothetical protein
MKQMIKTGDRMKKIVDIRDAALYREAVKVLEEYGIKYDKTELLDNPDMCLDIVRIFEYFRDVENREKDRE